LIQACREKRTGVIGDQQHGGLAVIVVGHEGRRVAGPYQRVVTVNSGIILKMGIALDFYFTQ
jgi:hypothetical protein